ncbi:MAG TPA: hypothetical protein VEK56_18520 [Vicinamibacterales bacterium]|nr:hypothetical protein [Vicinamibacterales bacterium]
MTLPVLLYRSFSRTRALLLSLAAVLVLFQVLVVSAATYLRETGRLSQFVALLPGVVQQMTSGIFAGFGNMVAVGYFHPVVIFVFVGTAIVVASEPAADVESGVVDLVLARPVARWRLVARSLFMMVLTTTAIAGLMLAASRLSITFVSSSDPTVSTRVLAKLAANLVAVAWVMGAVSLAAASIARRRAPAAGVTGIIALALYFLNLLAEIWPRMAPYGPLSPFHYYRATAIIADVGTRWARDIATLLAGASVFSIVAFIAFSRRDL